MIDALELRLLRVAYRRAYGSPEMPSPDIIDELAHALKSQVAVNTDLRDESELFYEELATKRKDHASDETPAVTTNDDSFTGEEGLKSPLARDVDRQITIIERELSLIETGWFHVGHKRDVPRVPAMWDITATVGYGSPAKDVPASRNSPSPS